MATEATFNNQLQALATATANFANGKDADIKNTIITALGGSTGGLLDPNLRDDGDYIHWEGNGVCRFSNNPEVDTEPQLVTKGAQRARGFYMLESDGTYTKDWHYIHWYGPE